MAACAGALLLLVAGTAAGVVALTRGGGSRTVVTAAGGNTAGEDAAGHGTAALPGGPVPAAGPRSGVARGTTTLPRTAGKADRTAPRRPAAAPVSSGAGVRPPSPAPTRPVLTSRTDVETREIPFETRVVRDPALPRGTKRVQTPGVPGVETLRYLVTLTDGQPTDKRLIDATVTRQPQHQIVAVGTRRAPAQHSDCGQGLNICVPLGRRAACLSDVTGRPVPSAVPTPPTNDLPGGLPGGLPVGDLAAGSLPGGAGLTGGDDQQTLGANPAVQIGDTDLLDDLSC